jgi:aldehyde dehydrogenase (NAD+)
MCSAVVSMAGSEVGGADSAILAAVSRLRHTFDTGKTRPAAWRLEQLEQLERMHREHENDMAEALLADLGKCRFESTLSETSFVSAEARYARKHLRRWMRPRAVSTPLMVQPGSSRIQPEPKGVVLIIGAWNYPLQLVTSPLVGAIAAGNTAVIKPSEVAANTSALVAKLLPRYLDPDAFAVIEGGVPETTELLAQRFDHILYTGNEQVARIVMAAAAKHLTPVTLELGGKSPCIVDKDAELEVTASRIAWGKFINAGQTCVAPDYVLAHRSIAAPLAEALTRKIHEFYGEDVAKSPDFARIISERHTRRLAGLLEGQRIHSGGTVDVDKRYVEPTIVLDPSPDSPIMQEEIFGPILPVLAVDEMHEAIAFAASRPKPLALYVFSNSATLQDVVLERVSAGSVCINDAVIFMVSPELPFGGVGNSGMGRYQGYFGFETFSHMKAVMHRSFRLDAPLRYPPYTDTKEKIMRMLG